MLSRHPTFLAVCPLRHKHTLDVLPVCREGERLRRDSRDSAWLLNQSDARNCTERGRRRGSNWPFRARSFISFHSFISFLYSVYIPLQSNRVTAVHLLQRNLIWDPYSLLNKIKRFRFPESSSGSVAEIQVTADASKPFPALNISLLSHLQLQCLVRLGIGVGAHLSKNIVSGISGLWNMRGDEFNPRSLEWQLTYRDGAGGRGPWSWHSSGFRPDVNLAWLQKLGVLHHRRFLRRD